MFLCSSLAEVNTLSSDGGPLRWVPVIESVIPITIHRKKVYTKKYSLTMISLICIDQIIIFDTCTCSFSLY